PGTIPPATQGFRASRAASLFHNRADRPARPPVFRRLHASACCRSGPKPKRRTRPVRSRRLADAERPARGRDPTRTRPARRHTREPPGPRRPRVTVHELPPGRGPPPGIRLVGGRVRALPPVPPLRGPQSYNVGAGMTRVPTAAAFIRENMPFDQPGTFTDQQAFDVAAHVSARPRPDFPDKIHDWPNGDAPPDVAYPTLAAQRKSAAAPARAHAP